MLRSAKVISAVIFLDGLLRAKQKIYTRERNFVQKLSNEAMPIFFFFFFGFCLKSFNGLVYI
jgi:hypothetical protein